MERIEINHLHVSFGEEKILKDICHSFEAGKIHGIVGNNGSGKTVLFKCICGLIIPSGGTVSIDGKIIGKDLDFPRSLGCLIENPGFLPGYSGFNNLRFLASIKNTIGKDKIIESIKEVGLDPYEKKHVEKYSLGMKQRLGIAQALMEDPELLILDEPLNGLDKNGSAEIKKMLKTYKNDKRIILITSHNAIDIEELCDTVSEMDNGVLTANNTTVLE